jgi:hypothetical protein
MSGYTFYWRDKDIFVATEREVKTLDLAKKVVGELGIKVYTKEYLKYVKSIMKKAELEISGKFITIKRDKSTVCDPEGKTMIFRII